MGSRAERRVRGETCMRKISKTLGLCCVAAFFPLLSCAPSSPVAPLRAEATEAPEATLSSSLPDELNKDGGGAPKATLAQAADFAWQEFFALNWPAATSDSSGNPQRDTPDTQAGCFFGDTDPKSPCAGAPLTWQTFRGKAEIFTNAAAPDADYDTPPNYAGVYPTGDPVQCKGGTSTGTAWVNLDETTQIFEDAMFAGAGPDSTMVNPSINSQPQLVRFLAKANRAEFQYYTKLVDRYGSQNPATFMLPSGMTLGQKTVTYFQTTGNPPPGGTDYISLPSGTIEIKAGWRMLTDDEKASGRYHVATVRYYEPMVPKPPFGQVQTCYRQGEWGLVALHIIQKTPSAPYFIFASFEQADNITDAAGVPVEDPDGVIPASVLENCPAGQSSPCPTTPGLVFTDTDQRNTAQVPPQVTLAPGTTYCNANKQLYYYNLRPAALPTAGRICVNYRDNPIPDTIIQANRTAHAQIMAYNAANNIKNSPWLFYKLLNVQYFPLSNDSNPTMTFPDTDPSTGNNAANFYLANIMVETNRPLQMFSGSLVKGNPGTGSNSNYDIQFNPSGTGIHKNLYYTPPGGTPQGKNMGGCMGCHGAQGQSQGGDFSVILARGQVEDPELVPYPPVTSSTGAARLLKKGRTGH